jgi:enoyl-CoA hydratase/carnithine racemase
MSDINTERTTSVLRVELNRPTKKNAMTGSMYLTLADVFSKAARDEEIRVVVWHGAGDSFSAGNDVMDFLEHPAGSGDSPQARLMNVLNDFDKPLIAAVQGVAIGGGTTMLTHCDFVYAGESAKFQMPFIKRLMKQPFRERLREAMKVENEEYASRLRSADTREALTAFLEKRAPDLTKPKARAAAQ